MNAQPLIAGLAGAAAIGLTGAHFLWLIQDLRNSRDAIEVEGSLRRLAALTIRNFPGHDLESAELFWKSIGREGNPMHDAWGTEYRIAVRDETGTKQFFWSSAGPDRTHGTRDDIEVQVPYPNGPGNFPDLGPNDALVPPPISNDAK